MHYRIRQNDTNRIPPGVVFGTLISVIVLGWYLYTLAPSVTWADGAKLQQEAIRGESFYMYTANNPELKKDRLPFNRLGVAAWDHPLYVVIGKLFTLLPVRDLPYRVNLVSAVFGTATVTVFYGLALRMTRNPMAAGIAAIVLAVSHTFWFHAVIPEVYTLNTFFLVLIIDRMFAFLTLRRYKDLLWVFFLVGLGISNHLLTGLALPAIALTLRGEKPEIDLRKLLGLGGALVAGLAIYLIQFARMVRLFSIGEVMATASGSMFLKDTIFSLSVGEILLSLGFFVGYLIIQFGPIGVGLGIYGVKKSRDYPIIWKLNLSFFVVYTLFSICYTVLDQFAFFLPSFVIFALFIAVGLEHLLDNPKLKKGQIVGLALGIFLAAGAVLSYHYLPNLARAIGVDADRIGVPQIGTGGARDGLRFVLDPNKRGDYGAAQYGQQSLSHLPDNAVVIAQYYTDSEEYHILRYFQTVEGIRPDVTIEGWLDVAYYDFSSEIVLQFIEDNIGTRPVYLASLDEHFYGVSQIRQNYIIRPEHGLYRIIGSESE